jgi:hypothetical protein
VPIRLGIAGLVVLVYVLAAHPTGAFTIILLAVAAFVLLVIELLARPPAGTAPPKEPTDGPGPAEHLEHPEQTEATEKVGQGDGRGRP